MRARFAASIVLAAGITLATAGCGFMTPLATTEQYSPSDGTQITVGDVKLLNVIVLSDDGDTGNMIASVVNSGSARASVKLQYEGDSGTVDKTISVPAGETKNVGTDDAFLLEGIGTEPGALLEVFVQHGDETGKHLLVPVLDGTLPEYTPYMP